MNCKLFLSCFLLVMFSLLITVNTFAQRVKPDRWFVSGDGGISVFFGDVKRYDYVPDFESPSEIQPMFSLNGGKELSPIFSVRGQFSYGKLSGHKQSAKYNFEGTTIGAHALVDFNLIYLLTKQRFGNSRINILASLGAGYMSWDSKLYSDYPLPDGSYLVDQNSNGAMSFPLALSMEYLITKNFSVGVSGLLYMITSDEVDVKPGGIKFDMINYSSIGFVYRFKTKQKTSRKSVKYRLDPSLYEPTEKDIAVEVAAGAAAVPKDEVNIDESVIENKELVIKEAQPEVKEAKDNLPEQKNIAVEESHKYKINHDLEEEAIRKETWATKEDNIWEGIVFSVQIAATKTPWDTEELKEEFGVTSRIYEKFDGSWHRYFVGHFNKMWRAKELRNSIRSSNGIEDAFIVVYRGDKVISLEEALNYAARQQTVVLIGGNEIEEEINEKKVYPLIRLDNSIPEEGIIIGIQILSMKNDHYPVGMLRGVYGIEKPVIVSKDKDWNKLIVIDFDSYNDALDYQGFARERGFIDAFVVAYKDGKRISISTLKTLINGQ